MIHKESQKGDIKIESVSNVLCIEGAQNKFLFHL